MRTAGSARTQAARRDHGPGTTRTDDHVYVEGQVYSARCDVLKYDTSKEQIILEASSPGTYAVLYREKYRGGARDKIEARKIFYDRLTGDYRAEGSRGTVIAP